MTHDDDEFDPATIAVFQRHLDAANADRIAREKAEHAKRVSREQVAAALAARLAAMTPEEHAEEDRQRAEEQRTRVEKQRAREEARAAQAIREREFDELAAALPRAVAQEVMMHNCVHEYLSIEEARHLSATVLVSFAESASEEILVRLFGKVRAQ